MPGRLSLKILHVLDHTLPLHSGYSFRTQNILKQQKNRGWTPVALTSPKHEASWNGPSQREEVFDGIRYYRAGPLHAGSLPVIPEIQLIRHLAACIEEVVKIEKPELLHAHSPVLNALAALWVGRKLGIPVVYEIRAFWEDAAVDHGTYSEGSWKYRAVRSAETWVCRRASQVAVLCDGLKDDLIKRGIPSKKLTVVFNGINPEEFRPCSPDMEFASAHGIVGKKVLGFIGSFYRYEGLDLLVKAMQRIKTRRNDVVLILVGGGETASDLRQQTEQLGLQDCVIFPGRIPHERIPGVYSLMDLLVYPRYSMRLTELVTPLKPLEAMAMGKPLIASDVGGHRELIRNNFTGLLFRAGSVDSLTKEIKNLLDDDILRNRLSAQGSDWARQHHTWEQTTAIYSLIYSTALEGKRPKRQF